MNPWTSKRICDSLEIQGGIEQSFTGRRLDNDLEPVRQQVLMPVPPAVFDIVVDRVIVPGGRLEGHLRATGTGP